MPELLVIRLDLATGVGKLAPMKTEFDHNDEIILPSGYRFLEIGETLKSEDLLSFSGEWVPTIFADGRVYERAMYIRKV